MEEQGITTEKKMTDVEQRNYLDAELRFISGVLDMLFLINEADAWEDRGEGVGAVILDARTRAEDLLSLINEREA